MPLDREALESIGETSAARTARAGEGSIRHGILIQSLISSSSSERPGILERVLNGSRTLVSRGQLKEVFSRQSKSVSGISVADVTKAIAHCRAPHHGWQPCHLGAKQIPSRQMALAASTAGILEVLPGGAVGAGHCVVFSTFGMMGGALEILNGLQKSEFYVVNIYLPTRL